MEPWHVLIAFVFFILIFSMVDAPMWAWTVVLFLSIIVPLIIFAVKTSGGK
ncbi:MAG: hypothetical protein GW775_02315 [Candidatus Magasanikbacteria bacterium]|nr:hypothetical protein [Candidatus Magasanikbacteria bacterium]